MVTAARQPRRSPRRRRTASVTGQRPSTLPGASQRVQRPWARSTASPSSRSPQPRRRRIRFLKQAYSILRPGGVFIISFARVWNDRSAAERFLQRLCVRLHQYAPFNKDYEPGDDVLGSFIHFFQPEELKQEFDEAKFIITAWLWDQGYAVLTKG